MDEYLVILGEAGVLHVSLAIADCDEEADSPDEADFDVLVWSQPPNAAGNGLVGGLAAATVANPEALTSGTLPAGTPVWVSVIRFVTGADPQLGGQYELNLTLEP